MVGQKSMSYGLKGALEFLVDDQDHLPCGDDAERCRVCVLLLGPRGGETWTGWYARAMELG